MTNSKPQTLEQYPKWLFEKHGIGKISLSHAYYESVSNKILMAFTGSDFWRNIQTQIQRLGQKYFMQFGYHLLATETVPDMKTKPFESFLQKTFRKNVIENLNWPNEPSEGWLLPDNWYSRINDITRTMFVVKYLDGVTFLVDNLRSTLSTFDMVSDVYFEAKEEGYYAAHLYTEYECEIPKEDWNTKKVCVKVEMQITTQLQEVIRNLLHKYYEEKRIRTGVPEMKWQWDYRSEEFATNYLGHILHYVEGMIMDIREKQKGASS